MYYQRVVYILFAGLLGCASVELRPIAQPGGVQLQIFEESVLKPLFFKYAHLYKGSLTAYSSANTACPYKAELWTKPEARDGFYGTSVVDKNNNPVSVFVSAKGLQYFDWEATRNPDPYSATSCRVSFAFDFDERREYKLSSNSSSCQLSLASKPAGEDVPFSSETINLASYQDPRICE